MILAHLKVIYADITLRNLFQKIDDSLAAQYLQAIAIDLQKYPHIIDNINIDYKLRDQDILIIVQFTFVNGGTFCEALLSIV
jgi:hypothetical protein